MRTGWTIKHERNTDVAFYIKKLFRVPDGRVKVKGQWVNIVNPERPYIIGSDNIVIQPENLKEWRIYEQN